MGQNTSGCFARNGGMSCADSHEESYRDCHGDLFPHKFSTKHQVESPTTLEDRQNHPFNVHIYPGLQAPK